MYHKRLSFRLLINVIAVGCFCLSPAFARKPDIPGGGNGGGGGNNSVSYEVVQLDSIEGAAYDINENGEVVGSRGGQPCYWLVTDGEPVSVVAQPLSLGATGGVTGGYASAINESGAICGAVNNDDVTIQAAVFWPSAVEEPIVLSSGAGALDVNNNGIVVGAVGYNAVAWHVAGDGTVVGPVLLGGSGAALSINDSNLVVGDDAFPGGQAVAWLLDWDGTDLNVVTQWPVIDPSGLVRSMARSVNEAGDILGELHDGANYPEAFLVNSALEPQTLPSLVDNRKQYTHNERPRDINNTSPPQILGYALVLDRRYGGQQSGSGWVIWQGDSVLSLADVVETTLPSLQNLQALNDSGWLVGWGAATQPSGGMYYPIVMIAR
jgi:hypothetical protein